jgi:hypothetical protein
MKAGSGKQISPQQNAEDRNSARHHEVSGFD